MDFFRTLTLGSRRQRIADVAGLATATGEGAAYLAQGSSFSYIRARSGTMGPRLMQDAGFGRGIERCKWEGFAAATGDLLLIAEGDLRPHGPVPAAVWPRLYRSVIEAQPLPEHRAGTGWDDRIAEFDRRLEAHLAGPAPSIEAVADFSGNVIMDYAPVDDTIRELDRAMVTNNVKFRFIEHVDGLRRRTDLPALAAALRAWDAGP